MALAKISVALEYHQGSEADPSPVVREEAIETESAPVAEHVSDDPSPMDVVDESCAIEVAAEPSAMEASTDPVAEDEGGSASFIVHELSDEDDEVEYTGSSSIERIPIDLAAAEKSDDPFIQMANNWYCCKVCSRLYQSFALLATHFREIHPNKAPWLRTKRLESYFTPKDSDVQQLIVGVKTYYKCDLCDTLFSMKRTIGRHRWRYHGAYDDTKKVFCPITGCGHFFMENRALSRHLGILHDVQADGKLPPAAAAAPAPASANDEDDDDVVVITDSVEDGSSAPIELVYTD